MYLLVEFTGNYGRWKKFTEEEWTELRTAIPSLPEKPPDWGPGGDHLLTDENISVVSKYGLQFQLSQKEHGAGLGTMLVKLQDRIRALELDSANKAELMQHGACVQIHIPDLVLLGFNEVQVLDNCCTDSLQEHLDVGWRIIAVCPPNAQRRPDYVIGRKK